MAEKKNWTVGWRNRENDELQTIKYNNVTLKSMYDQINEWNKDTIENQNPNEPYYYLVGEAK